MPIEQRIKLPECFSLEKVAVFFARGLGAWKQYFLSCFWVALSIMHARSPSCKLSVYSTPIMGVVKEIRTQSTHAFSFSCLHDDAYCDGRDPAYFHCYRHRVNAV